MSTSHSHEQLQIISATAREKGIEITPGEVRDQIDSFVTSVRRGLVTNEVESLRVLNDLTDDVLWRLIGVVCASAVEVREETLIF